MKTILRICAGVSLFFALGTPSWAQEMIRPIVPKFKPDPLVYEGKVEGDIPIKELVVGSRVNGVCEGFTIGRPSYILPIEAPLGYLSVKLRGEGITLMVKGPDGVYCRHEGQPEVSGAWVPGRYKIWVGTKQARNRVRYRLSISETQQ